MEHMYYKMYDEPELVDAVLTYIVDYYATVSERIFDVASDVIDVFFIGNDFGGQRGPLLSEEMFRRFILPHLARLVDLGHSYGLKVMMHCCGGFAELIPAMIEIGMDGLHALQPCCENMSPQRLKKDFGDKILLNGAIDSHHVLLESLPKEIRVKTREVVEIMMPGGGYVAGASHDWILRETPLENVLAMFDAIQEYGVYAKPQIGATG
jgi:uroporphyrinogen-III decarboxylase